MPNTSLNFQETTNPANIQTELLPVVPVRKTNCNLQGVRHWDGPGRMLFCIEVEWVSRMWALTLEADCRRAIIQKNELMS